MKYISWLFLSFLSFFSQSAVITVQAHQPKVGNCMPFGCPQRISSDSKPHAGYVYKDIAPFTVKAGDILAFDTGDVNDQILNFDIAFMHIKENTRDFGLIDTFKTVVTNGIGSGMGNTIVGDFDVAFVIDTDYTFTGGGLVIDLIPRGLSRTDNTFVGNLVGTNIFDTSYLFVGRYFKRKSVAGKITSLGPSSIANFRLIMQDPVSTNPPPPPGSGPNPTTPTYANGPTNTFLFVFISVFSLVYRKFTRS